MQNIKGKRIKLTKIRDIKNNNSVHNERIDTAFDNVIVGQTLRLGEQPMTTCHYGLTAFPTYHVIKVNDDMTFETNNAVYRIEILSEQSIDEIMTKHNSDVARIKDLIDNPQQLPVPGRMYQHYNGGIYEVLYLAQHTTTKETLVIYKSLHYGTNYARPLTEWFDIIMAKEQNDGYREIRRFEIYNGLRFPKSY